MRTSKGKIIPLGISILWILAMSIFMISSDVHASLIQRQRPEVIFAANCSTCHGAMALGGVSWIKNGPDEKRYAPALAGKSVKRIKKVVREGMPDGAMPAFGPEEITNAELNDLAKWLRQGGDDKYKPNGVNPPAAPVGTEVRLDILDADPWFSDGARSDDTTKPGGADHDGRVKLLGSEYLKVVNTGRTWHTFTNPAKGKDSGFIGYAGNYVNTPGDIDNDIWDIDPPAYPGADVGYYYAGQTTGLASGCVRYLCKMHPYMQVEVCTPPYDTQVTPIIGSPAGDGPLGPTTPLGLTRAHKHAIGLPPVAGVGEVWVDVQSQEEPGEDTTTIVDNSVGSMAPIGKDGALGVINASNWGVSRIADVGNNPHNSWPGTANIDGVPEDVVMTTSWHDNLVTVVSAGSKTKWPYESRSGASNAHVMVTPGAKEVFYVTHMGGMALQAINTTSLMLGLNPNLGWVIRGKRSTGPHGLWMCDEVTLTRPKNNKKNYILTADTFSNTATIWDSDSRTKKAAKAKSVGTSGKAPLAPSIMSGFDGPATNELAGCTRGFTNNALSANITIYNIKIHPKSGKIQQIANIGTIALRDTTTDQVPDIGLALTVGAIEAPGGIFTAKWVHLPIQTPVSPAGSTHPRYMVTANKASFNVSITALDSATGLPTTLYTVPAGLGAHGVTYGRKSGAGINYYAYVTNTFEDYVSVYDLAAIAAAGLPGSALIAERVYVEGGAVAAVIALDVLAADLCNQGTVLLGGLAYTSDECLALGLDLNGDGTVVGATCVPPTPNTTILDCGVGPTGGFYVSNLPIGVLCPNCSSGIHVGDIPLPLTTGAALAGPIPSSIGVGGTPLANSGAGSKYTYLKEEVWVDTETVACVLVTLDTLTGFAGGALVGANNCGPGADLAGTLNLKVELDLDLGINTGGQGIVGVPAAPPWP